MGKERDKRKTLLRHTRFQAFHFWGGQRRACSMHTPETAVPAPRLFLILPPEEVTFIEFTPLSGGNEGSNPHSPPSVALFPKDTHPLAAPHSPPGANPCSEAQNSASRSSQDRAAAHLPALPSPAAEPSAAQNTGLCSRGVGWHLRLLQTPRNPGKLPRFFPGGGQTGPRPARPRRGPLPARSGPAPRRPGRSGPAAASPWPCSPPH